VINRLNVMHAVNVDNDGQNAHMVT